MMKRITPLIKGLITGAVMVIAMLWLSYKKTPQSSAWQYSVYILYAAGIAWTLIDYSRSENYMPRFGAIFGQGFRCFIIVTLIIVACMAIYIRTHPEMIEEDGKLFREYLVKEGNKTPAEIESMVTAEKKQFLMKNVSVTIFGTLMTGAVFTAAGAGLLLIRRK